MVMVTTTHRRKIRRMMTVVAAMMIVVGVIVMHSFMAGHGPMARPEQTLGAALHHQMPHEKMVMHESRVMAAPDPSPNLAPVLWVMALTGTIVAGDHVTAAMCLAVLPPTALLMVIALLRLKSRQLIAPSEREVPQRWVAVRGSPPRPNTPSLSQLCVLRA